MCSHTPRFSYGTSITAVPTMRTPWCSVCAGWVYGRGMVPGWVGGWVYREGNTGPSTLLEERYPDSEAGPGRPSRGLEWVVWVARTPAGSCTTLRARSVPCWALPVHDPAPRAIPASGPIWARFRSIFSKVSQNEEVSPKSVDKACHSPYSQNGPRNSPLEILRFPFLVAFSPKELMGLF